MQKVLTLGVDIKYFHLTIQEILLSDEIIP